MINYRFADIILPLAVRGRFTYMIPDNLACIVKPGVRVEVQFGGKNLYSGIVCNVHNIKPDIKNVKEIIRIIDVVPAVNAIQLKLWEWISEYYLCSEGEVMKAALPSAVSLSNYKPKLESYISPCP